MPADAGQCQAIAALSDKAAQAGITIEPFNERGTSPTCPSCQLKVAGPMGRRFFCPTGGPVAHRDVVGAANIDSRRPRGGEPFGPSGLELMHRRAGRPLPGRIRRDPTTNRQGTPSRVVGSLAGCGLPEHLGESLDRDAPAS